MMSFQKSRLAVLPICLWALFVSVFLLAVPFAVMGADADAALERAGVTQGICVVLGLPQVNRPEALVELAKGSEFLVYFQSDDPRETKAVRRTAEEAGLLGNRIFAQCSGGSRVLLADNLASAVVVYPSAVSKVAEAEILRVLHPGGQAFIGANVTRKDWPEGNDHWPYHAPGPDNNPCSHDQNARSPYLTQFIAEPKFCPMPVITVGAAGRLFKAYGHVAQHEHTEHLVNTLICYNAFSGMPLWKRPLRERFMIQRNTIIATADVLYLADDQSCKLLDTETGRLLREIKVPEQITEGPVWKWMALGGDVLYALVGGQERPAVTTRAKSKTMGRWPPSHRFWEGYRYQDGSKNFAVGRTFAAFDVKTGKLRWSKPEPEHIDGRGVCSGDKRIYYCSPGNYLACLDAATGRQLWRNTDDRIVEATANFSRQQRMPRNADAYLHCDSKHLFLSGKGSLGGPSKGPACLCLSTEDGSVVTDQFGRAVDTVVTDGGLFLIGSYGRPEGSAKLEYGSWKVLGPIKGSTACTRATGSIDSIFHRASDGTVQVDIQSGRSFYMTTMRPPCTDGVVVSDGLLFWGPWACMCSQSLFGHVALGPAGDFDFHPAVDQDRLDKNATDTNRVAPFQADQRDWLNACGTQDTPWSTTVRIPDSVDTKWSRQISNERLSPPVVAGDTVFVGDYGGRLFALDTDRGNVRWKAYTGGAIYGGAAICAGRVFAGSADGHVYCFEAATGKLLWRFRAAPAQRLIPVFGRLSSNWPAAGGVVAKDGVVYAAAGITDYDGTYVYALDAATGAVRWHNDTPGRLGKKTQSGVFLQGPLYLAGGELRFTTGGQYGCARFDLRTGRCLNEPIDSFPAKHAYRTVFYPYYPKWGAYVFLRHRLDDDTTLFYNRTMDSEGFFLHNGAPKPLSRWKSLTMQPRKVAGELVWERQDLSRLRSIILAGDRLLVAGDGQTGPFAAALRTKDGESIWQVALKAPTVKHGVAFGRNGRAFISLENGQVACLAP